MDGCLVTGAVTRLVDDQDEQPDRGGSVGLSLHEEDCYLIFRGNGLTRLRGTSSVQHHYM